MSLPSHCTDINSTLDYLYGLQRFGIKLGLEHTERLLSACGNPHRNFRSIHIAGTNGKGSTTKFIASILQESGYKTGVYTSPHLIAFNERISINGDCIHDEDVAAFISEFKNDISEIESTFFETTTAMAFWYFSRNNTDIAVVETGMGGRLDSTNVLTPDKAVITSIGLDHCERLGDTIEEIAREKAGIIKPGIPVFVSQQKGAPMNEIAKIAIEKDAPLTVIDNVIVNKKGTKWNHFTYRDEQYSISLSGSHQLENAALAIETVKAFDSAITPSKIRNGLRKTVWRGRMEQISSNPDCYYDVAHNPQSIGAVLRTIEAAYDKQPIGVMVLKEGKNISQVSEILKDRFDTLIASTIPNVGLCSSNHLAVQMQDFGVEMIEMDDFSSALTNGKSLVTNNQCLLIFGSHYVAGDVYNAFDFSFAEAGK